MSHQWCDTDLWSRSSPKFSHLFTGPLPTFPENFTQIRLGVLNPDLWFDRHQNLIVCSLAHCQLSLQISCKSVWKFLHKVANGHTDRQTDRQTNDDNITSLVEVTKLLHNTATHMIPDPLPNAARSESFTASIFTGRCWYFCWMMRRAVSAMACASYRHTRITCAVNRQDKPGWHQSTQGSSQVNRSL